MDFVPNIPSALNSLGIKPYVLTGYVRQLLLRHFGKGDQILEPNLRSLIWSKVNTTTEIEIETVTRWKPSSTETRPALIIKRNDITTKRIAINDQQQGLPWDGTSHTSYSLLVEGSHTVFCISTRPMVAEILGVEILELLTTSASMIREDLQLLRVAPVGAGSVSELQELPKNYVVPVSVAWVYSLNWRQIPNSPLLKTISLSEFIR